MWTSERKIVFLKFVLQCVVCEMVGLSVVCEMMVLSVVYEMVVLSVVDGTVRDRVERQV